ncbi:hypothetical protein DY000_02008457 [Brassica cretica]|uniref:5-amino-6-(5-phosphoribosylamino)uracil reductase n=1 Tax=Brassica cretica TaxID=69181 RepID=A0ABQ7C5S9_BRACR|nr:hypothetical protein DY000_02008457 [Brassica cretica]
MWNVLAERKEDENSGTKAAIWKYLLGLNCTIEKSDGGLDFYDEHNHEDELITARKSTTKEFDGGVCWSWLGEDGGALSDWNVLAERKEDENSGTKAAIWEYLLGLNCTIEKSDGELDFDDEHNHEDELITARRARRKSSAVEFVGRGSEKTVTRSRIGLFTTGKIGFTGTKPAEALAVEAAGEFCRGSTAYLNMEPGDCHGDHTAVSALVQAGVGRVVVGIRHPLQHLRGSAIREMRSHGIEVNVLGEDFQSKVLEDARKCCLLVNAPLIHRACSRVPFSLLKYAMTLDGKIAASSGHAAWISSKLSRTRVFELRGRSDAVIVGGNTVRQDDPRLTARHGQGHTPTRIVMSQSLDLPEKANLWDVSEVSTIVATQRGARKSYQKFLASKGVEVVEFDMLNPREVMEYFHLRGYLSILWECGGTLAASAIASGVIHKVVAFIAPKIIGGSKAPSPVGELGMVEMTQALNLIDVCYEQVGPDMLVSGFLQPVPDLLPVIPSEDATFEIDPSVNPFESSIIFFYKTWDLYGSFSNFSPHPIRMPYGDDYRTWSSVEHYYQLDL